MKYKTAYIFNVDVNSTVNHIIFNQTIFIIYIVYTNKWDYYALYVKSWKLQCYQNQTETENIIRLKKFKKWILHVTVSSTQTFVKFKETNLSGL